jgi:lipid II:glycine glycyltransferase (peptidoglycan interpeptide bridge formation enzyme)
LNGRYNLIKLNPTVIVELAQPEKMLSNFRKNFRYDIRKSYKQGLTVRIATTKSDWAIFKKIYEETMKHLSADEYYFFTEEYYNFLAAQEKNVFLLLAEFQNEVIGASCFFYDKYCLHYHLSGMKRKFSKLNANKRLLFEAFKLASVKGCKFAHLGGGVGGSEEDSLMKFKAGFSSLREQFYIAKRIHDEEVYDKICQSLGLQNEKSGFFPAYRASSIKD